MFIYAISLPFTSPLSSIEPIDGISMDELRTKSRRKAITDSYSTGGLLTLTDENTEHIEQLVFYRYLKIGVGKTIIQAVSECLKNCLFSVVDDCQNLARLHEWCQHRGVAKTLFPESMEENHFTFSDFEKAYPTLSKEDAAMAFLELLRHKVIATNQIN